MKLVFYGLKDNVEGEFVFFFQAKNEGINSTAVEKAISIISKEGAIEEAALIARDLKDNAIKKISENWKDSKAKDNIIELFDLM